MQKRELKTNDDLSVAFLKADRMRYQKNGMSFWFCLLGLAFNVAYFIIVYKSGISPDIIIGADVIVNIVFMLVVFMGAEKSKAYVYKWSFVLMAVGAVQLVRIFIVPVIFFRREMLMGGSLITVILALMFSAASLITAGIVCFKRSSILNAHIKAVNKSES